eukprot:TRINITY_DN4577_c0_g2_i2.p1 TRINITY_DN4577_c0_g2~~TRINITY_DN4577_c0_g2_i2.p1  ORF type:complete len:600 (-),score=241.63 TRINITY_DN4577_c0_g2_i2:111-1910(-)
MAHSVLDEQFFFFFFFKQKTAYEMLRSLVGSEMCIRDREDIVAQLRAEIAFKDSEIARLLSLLQGKGHNERDAVELRNQLSSARRQCDVYVDEINLLKRSTADVSRFEALIADKDRAHARSQQENDKLRAELSAMRNRCAEYELKISSSSNMAIQLDKFASQEASLQARIRSLEADLARAAEAKVTHVVHDEGILQQQQQLTLLYNQNQELKLEISSLTSLRLTLSERDTEIRRLTSSISEWEAKYDRSCSEWKLKVDGHVADINRLTLELAECRGFGARVAELERLLRLKTEEYDQLAGSSQSFTLTIEGHLSEISRLKIRIQELESNHIDQDAFLRSQQQVREGECTIAALRAELDGFRLRISELEGLLSAKIQEYELQFSSSNEFRLTIEGHLTTIARLEAKIAELEAGRIDREAFLRSQQQVREGECTIIRLNEELASFRLKITDLEGIVSAKTREYELLISSSSEYKLTIERHLTEISRLKLTISELEENRIDREAFLRSQQQVREGECRIIDLEAQLSALRLTVADLEGIVAAKTREYELFLSSSSEYKLTIEAHLSEISRPVSYTHLRAHETPEHLVCRLLLEKKKKKKLLI